MTTDNHTLNRLLTKIAEIPGYFTMVEPFGSKISDDDDLYIVRVFDGQFREKGPGYKHEICDLLIRRSSIHLLNRPTDPNGVFAALVEQSLKGETA